MPLIYLFAMFKYAGKTPEEIREMEATDRSNGLLLLLLIIVMISIPVVDLLRWLLS